MAVRNQASRLMYLPRSNTDRPQHTALGGRIWRRVKRQEHLASSHLPTSGPNGRLRVEQAVHSFVSNMSFSCQDRQPPETLTSRATVAEAESSAKNKQPDQLPTHMLPLKGSSLIA